MKKLVLPYESLLDRLYSSLPEKKASGERFEVPAAEVLVQGNRTIIKNYDAICSALRRKPEEVAKYLFKELAVPGTAEAGRLVLQSRFGAKTVNDKISSYAETHVICRECKKPDTRIEEFGRGIKILVCEACGARNPVRS